MEGEEGVELGRRTLHKVSNGPRFGLREGASAGKGFGTGLLGRALAAPMEAEVAVQIDAGTASGPQAAHILAPQTILGVRVFVAIGIRHGQDVPVHVANMRGLVVERLDKLINYIGDGGRTDPLSGMDASVHPDGLVILIPIRNTEDLQRSILDREADRFDAAQLGIGLRQVVQIPMDVLHPMERVPCHPMA